MNTHISRIFYMVCCCLFASTRADINQEWAQKVYQKATQKHGTQDAKKEYQQLGNEALRLLKLTAPTYFCIKTLAKSSPDYDNNAYDACHLNGAVFINEENFEHKKTGVQRLTIFHEIIHLKQFMKNNGQVNVCNTRYKSIEQEADLEAAKAGNCWKCTQEFSAKAESQNSTSDRAQKLRKEGYATTEEFLALAAQQKEAGACCQYHKH